MATGTATDLRIPMLVLVAGADGVRATLPSLTMGTVGAAVTLPKLTVIAGMDSAFNSVAASLPIFVLDGEGTSGNAGTIATSLPLLQIAAGSAPRADLVLPVITISATGKTGLAGSLAQVLPALTASGFIIPFGQGLVSAALPLLTISASGLSNGLGTVAASFRVLQLSATGYAGTVSTGANSFPSLVGAALGYGQYTLSAALRLPMLSTAGGVLVPTLPASYRTWVLNTRKKGLTEYDWSFNSYATFRGIVLAAGSTGLFKLDGSNLDAAAPIIATVRTGKDNFGTSMNKRVPRVYVSVDSGASLQVTTITTQGGRRSYMVNGNGVTGIQQRRVPIGRGPKSPDWQFELTNPDGTDFLLKHLAVRPEKSYRRVV